MKQAPMSGNGGNNMGVRHLHPTLSPDSDSDSDSDISLGTHSPIPSMTSQHSPNSSSGLNDRDLDRLAEEHRDSRGEKEYRSFASLQSFRFGEHINVGFQSKLQPAADQVTQPSNHNWSPSDAFNRQFLPNMPYRIGAADNASPTHSPPIGITPSSTQTGQTSGAPNPAAYNLPVGLIRPQPQLPQNAMAAMVAACVANGQSPGNPQTLLHHHLNQVAPANQQSPLRIRINSPTRINSTSSASHSSNDVITTTAGGSPTIPGATAIAHTHHLILNGSHLARMSQMSHLHRPFESQSPKVRETSSWPPLPMPLPEVDV